MRSVFYRGWFIGLIAGARMECIRGSPLAKVISQVVRDLDGDLYPDVSKLFASCVPGATLADLPGYCYLAMIRPRYHIAAMIDIGPNPTILALTRARCNAWWDTAAWSNLYVEKTGDSQVHVATSGRHGLLTVLSEVSPWFLVDVGVGCVPISESSFGITEYMSVGMAACYARTLAQAYCAFPMSLQYCMQQAVRGHVGAILASVYADADLGHVDSELSVETGYFGSTVLRVPSTATNVAYLLPPGWYYCGPGFKIGSAVKPTVLLVPRAYGIRVSTDAPFTCWTVDPRAFQLAYADACANPWWDALWSRGFSVADKKVRTMSNVLIHTEAWQDTVSPVSRLEWLSMSGSDKQRYEDRVLHASGVSSESGRVDAFAILRKLERRLKAQVACASAGMQCVRGRGKLPVVEATRFERGGSCEVVRENGFAGSFCDRGKDLAKDYLSDSALPIDVSFTSVDGALRAGAIASNYSDVSSRTSSELRVELADLSSVSSLDGDRGVSSILLPFACAATVRDVSDLSWLDFVDRAYDCIDHTVLDKYDVVGVGDPDGFSIVPAKSNGNARRSIADALERLSFDRGGIGEV